MSKQLAIADLDQAVGRNVSYMRDVYTDELVRGRVLSAEMVTSSPYIRKVELANLGTYYVTTGEYVGGQRRALFVDVS